MNNRDTKKSFFGLSANEEARIVKEAAGLASKEQLDLVNRHGGVGVIKNYCKCE